MRRRLLFAVVASVFSGASAFAQTPLKAKQVAPEVWMVQGEAALGSSANRNFISNAGFVVTREGVVVVDALGSPTLAEELLAAIARVTPLPVRHVVVTHYHADHIYGLQVFKARGAQIHAGSSGRDYLSSENAQLRLKASREDLFHWIDERTQLTSADQWLHADSVLELGGERFRILMAGPAHTPEDLVVLHEKSSTLFAGDLVFRGRVPFVGQADSSGWIRALDRLLALAPRRVVPGHGPMSSQAARDIQITRDYLVFLREAMGQAAADLEPFEQAYARTDWRRFEHMPLFKAANRINAYNTYLLMEQEGAKR
jgi:glyoxylase-like metal-dependent hydrolase (beta-lactamase superfamily II)